MIFQDRMGLVAVNNFQTLHHHCLIHYQTIDKYQGNLLWFDHSGKHEKKNRWQFFEISFVFTLWSNLDLSNFRFCICILTFYQLIDQQDKLESTWSSCTKNYLPHSRKRPKMDNLPTIFENFFQPIQHEIHGKVR